MELDLIGSRLRIHTQATTTDALLTGQPAAAVATRIRVTLIEAGVDGSGSDDDEVSGKAAYPAYSASQAGILQGAIASVAAAPENFRAGIREESSPIQMWPHHLDLSMIRLPGEKIPGEDPEDEETSDKQMNFGFSLGDSGISEPYLYVTAYPLPKELPKRSLPTQGLSGAQKDSMVL